jgi:hypothetical protein
MRPTRRRNEGPPTPDTNRKRIIALEKVTDQHRRELEIQLQRIAQLQADLDAIRSAWVQAKAVQKDK